MIAIVYALLLSSSATIKGLVIRKSSLCGYMDAVAQYSVEACGCNITLDPNPKTDPAKWKKRQMISYIKQYQKKLKGRANKKEPLTKQMILFMIRRSKKCHKDNLTYAIID